MVFCALRGAITVDRNDSCEILMRTKELLIEIIRVNEINTTQIVSIIFTATLDLDAVYPAVAARDLGMNEISLICCQEMRTINSLPMCVRVLMHVQSVTAIKPRHVYLRDAVSLRPDLALQGCGPGGDGVG